MMRRIIQASPFISLALVTCLGVASLHCGSGEGASGEESAAQGEDDFDEVGDRTSWDDNMVVMRERYRRLGIGWQKERAREDTRCIIRSSTMHNVIVVGEVNRAFSQLGTAAPCDYDSVIIGAKTFIVGIDKATDRVMIYGGWKRAEDAKRIEIFRGWFYEGLTAGVILLDAVQGKVVNAAGKTWKPPSVRQDGKRFIAEGWVKVPSVTSMDRYELRSCAIGADLIFEGCDTIDHVGNR